MSCRVESSRNAYQANLAHLNAPWLAKHAPELTGAEDKGDPACAAPATTASEHGRDGERRGKLRADGDADVEPGEYLEDFVVPACVRCGGILKVNAQQRGGGVQIGARTSYLR